jgi:hypothetical protein
VRSFVVGELGFQPFVNIGNPLVDGGKAGHVGRGGSRDCQRLNRGDLRR